MADNNIVCIGAEAVVLSCSGLDQSEGFWIRRLVRALGQCSAVVTLHLLIPEPPS